MKDWLTIGQFSKRVGVSAKALRIYEKMGLLRSHARGDNGYRIYYFSKNTNLEKQIRYIGGVISDGEDITIYGFNRLPRSQMKLDKTLSLDEEIILLSSLAAVMEIGLPMEKFPLVVG